MRKFWKKLMAVVCLTAMVLSGVAAHAEGEKADVSGSKKAAPTELACENRDTTVTLSLPSGEYKYIYDIVFVMDSSSSTANSNIDFSASVQSLLDEVKDKNISLKVGVIKARGLVFDTIDMVSNGAQSKLVEYSDSTKQVITDAINVTEAQLKALSSGTNMHGALKLADEWLTEDTSVSDDHKYVFFLTDGKTYIWNDENDIPTSVYGQYMSKNTVYAKPAVGQQTIAYSKSAYKFTDGNGYYNSATADELANMTFDEYFAKTHNFYANDFAKLYASANEELSGKTKYDHRCGYAYKESATADGTVTEHNVSNGGSFTYNLHKKYYEFTPAEAFADLNWLQAHPYVVQENEGTYTYDTTTPNPDFYQLHPDGLQKALYLTGHLWTDMVAKYNCAAINYNGWGSGSGLEIAKSFNEWIKSDGISDYAADLDDATTVSAIFNSIKDDIIYMIDSGMVTDVIGDDFTLLNPEAVDCFRMTVNGETLEATVHKVDGSTVWIFGDGDIDDFDYAAGYENDDLKTLYWVINVPVENAKPVTLSYDLRLREDATTDFYETNKSAILTYKMTGEQDDDGNNTFRSSAGHTYTFEVPIVSYIACCEIEVEKVWNDNDNAAGKRPDKVTMILTDDMELNEWTLELNEGNEWKGKFAHDPDNGVALPDSKLSADGKSFIPVVYVLKEVEVPDYESELSGDPATGFTVTNTYIPPETEETTEEETTPPTGDSMNILPFAGLFLMAAAAFVLVGKTRTREEN